MLPGPQIMTGLRETDRLADTANLRRTTDGSRYGRPVAKGRRIPELGAGELNGSIDQRTDTCARIRVRRPGSFSTPRSADSATRSPGVTASPNSKPHGCCFSASCPSAAICSARESNFSDHTRIRHRDQPNTHRADPVGDATRAPRQGMYVLRCKSWERWMLLSLNRNRKAIQPVRLRRRWTSRSGGGRPKPAVTGCSWAGCPARMTTLVVESALKPRDRDASFEPQMVKKRREDQGRRRRESPDLCGDGRDRGRLTYSSGDRVPVVHRMRCPVPRPP